MLLERVVVALVVVSAIACAPPNPAATQAAPPADTAPAVSASGLPLVYGNAPRGAVVTLEPAPPRALPLPAGPAVMDQFAKQFMPNMLFVRVGQPLEFRNSEDMGHNVHVVRSRTGAAVFHVSLDQAEKYVHTFDQAGQYEVSCDLHPGMLASIVATSTPHYAVADDAGRFVIRDVEAGAYTLTLSYDGRDVEQALNVAGPRTEVNLRSR